MTKTKTTARATRTEAPAKAMPKTATAKAAPAKEKPAPADPKAIAAALKSGARHTEARLMEVAAAGIMPPAPDFSAETHRRFRKRLSEVEALAKAGDLKGLRAYAINPVSSSPRAIDRYRRAAIAALEARAAAGQAPKARAPKKAPASAPDATAPAEAPATESPTS
jgi:hypothetical protein